MEGGDRTPKFGIPPVFKGPGSTEGLSPGEQKLRSAISADSAGMARYIMTGLGEYLGNMLTASHEAHAAQMQSVLANQGKIYEELQSTRRKVAALEAKLEHQSIQQNRIAATVAQGTTAAPPPAQRNEEQEKKEREKRERERREGQKRMEAGKREEGQKRMEAEKERAPEERRREKGKETAVETEETEETAEGEWTSAGGSKRSKKSTWANRADATTEQERASVAQPLRRPRPQRLIPKEKYPKAQREVIVEFEELKRPQGIDDRHLPI
jgi:type IV secretory pathway VirB10-like protein